jgi:hypothetical protein
VRLYFLFCGWITIFGAVAMIFLFVNGRPLPSKWGDISGDNASIALFGYLCFSVYFGWHTIVGTKNIILEKRKKKND